MKISVIEKYKILKKQLEELRDDIKCTERIINDPKIDWFTKHEFQNDIREDRRNLMAVNEQMTILMDYIYQNNMQDAINEINNLKEEEGKNKL